jgi:hypothetical protein
VVLWRVRYKLSLRDGFNGMDRLPHQRSHDRPEWIDNYRDE